MKVVVRVTEPAVPVKVMGNAPTVADALAVRVKVVPQFGVQFPGLNDAVTPAGKPDTLKVTL